MEWYPESKVYFDGSHYVAIPHTTNPTKRRRKYREEVITVADDKEDGVPSKGEGTPILRDEDESKRLFEKYGLIEMSAEDAAGCPFTIKEFTTTPNNIPQVTPKGRKMTRRQLFDELYAKYITLKKNEQKNNIIKEMRPYFKSDEGVKNFVTSQYERKERNNIARRMRFVRKAMNQHFNYFVTITYDDKKHTEESFRKKLMYVFSNMASKKGWRYMGVWERGEMTNRLHFHGLFSIPDGALNGGFIDTTGYSFKSHNRKTVHQSNFFLDRFGRNDFEELNDIAGYTYAIGYILKYINKTQDKIVYSRGLYQYFISDISEDDVASRMGIEDHKMVLFDDFQCWDEGVLMGNVSPEVIAQMRKVS
jgi:hypothetical protein